MGDLSVEKPHEKFPGGTIRAHAAAVPQVGEEDRVREVRAEVDGEVGVLGAEENRCVARELHGRYAGDTVVSEEDFSALQPDGVAVRTVQRDGRPCPGALHALDRF